MIVALLPTTLALVAEPPTENIYRTQWGTSAIPAATGLRCFEDDTCFAECGVNFRSVSATRNPLSCWDQCCPDPAPIGTCYVDTYCLRGCAEGYESVAQEHPCKDLCCVPGSCFWYKRQLINGCGCPAGSAVASEIGLCDWALCCPADAGGVPRQQQVTTQTPAFDIHRGSRGRHVTGGQCSNMCVHSHDMDCDDGGYGSEYSLCVRGTDCGDCGSRLASEEEPAALAPDALVEQQHAKAAHRRAAEARVVGAVVGVGALAAAAVARRRRRAASADLYGWSAPEAVAPML